MNEPNISILIVDDVPQNIQVVANILKTSRYDINFALDGRTALEYIQTNRYDLILLDIMMPEMNGFDVCKKIKEIPHAQNIPIVFLSALNEIQNISKGFEIGGVDYITKPFNATELLVRVKNHVELYRQRERLDELNRMKDKFFSIIAHDLKNPFYSILGVIDLIRHADSEEEKTKNMELLDLLHDTASNSYNLLENLLLWSRSQLGKVSFNPVPVNLENVISESFGIMNLMAKSKNITLVSNCFPGLEIVADENMLKTILRNIVSNAIKFTRHAGTIVVNAFEQNSAKIIEIIDDGVGMSEKVAKSLFKLGSTQSHPGTDGETGTGLGLIITKEFLDRHQAKIEVESKVGEGTKISLAFVNTPE